MTTLTAPPSARPADVARPASACTTSATANSAAAARPVSAAGASQTATQPAEYRGSVPRASINVPWDRLRLNRTESQRSARQQTTALRELATSPVPADPAGPWAAALSRMCVEALLGIRAASQLQRWLTPDLYDAVSRRAGLAVRIGGRRVGTPRPRIISHHAQVADDERSAEVCVILHDGSKVRAVALRLEAFRGRWRASAIEIG